MTDEPDPPAERLALPSALCYATDICRAERPVLTDYGNAHLAACHHPLGGAASTTRGG